FTRLHDEEPAICTRQPPFRLALAPLSWTRSGRREQGAWSEFVSQCSASYIGLCRNHAGSIPRIVPNQGSFPAMRTRIREAAGIVATVWRRAIVDAVVSPGRFRVAALDFWRVSNMLFHPRITSL